MAKLDQKKIALVHVVKRELRLTDEEYRTILKTHAGVTSAKDLDDAGFRRLMQFLVRSRHYRISNDGLTLKQRLFIRGLAEEIGWDVNQLNDFCRKYYHQPRAENLTRRQAVKVIETLKSIRSRQ